MKIPTRSIKALGLLALGLMFVFPLSPQSVAADTVQSTDFRAKSFSKVVDWFDYVREYAAEHGFPCDTSCQTNHAYLYTNFINVGGFQLFYVGLVNATDNGKYITIPLQTFFEHYKTPGGKTAVTASSFISLVAFRDNATSSLYPDSPDRGDDLYASFSLGVNLTAFAGRSVPPYVAGSQIIPLTSLDDNHWTWGLKYTNLVAIWWRVGTDPLNAYYDSNVPRGLARYAELTFMYDLTIDPSAKTAKLTASYTIGQMTDLWLLAPTPVRHLNATGTYDLDGALANAQTLYDHLQTNQFKLSIVLAHKSILVSQSATQRTTDRDDSGTNVTDTERDVSRSAINTAAPDGERIFRTDFGVKPQYQLFDPNGSNPTTYNATTRTVRRLGWGTNPVFRFQNTFMGFLPLFIAHVDPALIQQARSGAIRFDAADYLYIIAYPQWGGTKIVHDPDFTAIFQPSSNAGFLTILFIAIAAAAAVGGVFAFLFRRRKAANIAATGYPGQAPPGQGPAPAGPPQPSH